MFDDGQVTFYRMTNTAGDGNMPSLQPVVYSHMAFDTMAMGFQNYETSMQNNDRIDTTIICWQDMQVCRYARQFQLSFDDETVDEKVIYYRLKLAQPYIDDKDGLRKMRIYLERIADDEES
jgi:hypothetical protein